MLITMQSQATEKDVSAVVEKIETMGYKAHPIPGAQRTAIGITGNTGEIDPGAFELMPGVAEVIRVSKPYKLVSREVKPENTVVQIGPGRIGGGELSIIAGPCGVETREQTMAAAEAVAACGVKLFRGGLINREPRPTHSRGSVWRG